jgi:predicted NAD/FAD-dependent oxidoreductase
MATRRTGALQFDHGAQFMRAHGPAFAARLDAWERRGIVGPWAGGGRRVGIPGMTAPVHDLLAGLSVASATTVTRLVRSDTSWHLSDAWGTAHGPYDTVAITIPSPQAAALLDQSGFSLRGIEVASYAPCWSLMLAVLDAPSEILIQADDDPVGLIALDSSKPGRPEGARLTVHATPAWSRRQVDEPHAAIVAALTRAASERLGTVLEPTYAEAHRWRYAQVKTALGMPCLYDTDLRLGAAGDWCLGARIEAAHDSGLALAEAILSDLGAAA